MSYRYCADLIKNHDYEHYVMILCLPAAIRNRLFALCAFRHEIAKTRFIVSEATLGMIRLQWWRDTIKSIVNGNPVKHEVVQALYQANQDGAGWIESDFIALIDAYEDFFVMRQWPDDEAIWHFMRTSSQAFMHMVYHALGQDMEEDAKKVGAAHAMIEYLRAVPYDLKNGRAVFSETLVAGIQNDLNKNEHLITIVRTIMPDIQSLLSAGSLRKNTYASVMRIIALLRFGILQKENGDIFHPRFQNTDPLLALYVWMRRWRHRKSLFKTHVRRNG